MNKVVLILLIAAVGFGLVSLHLVGELRAERAQVAALQTEIEQLRSSSSARAAPNPLVRSQAQLASRIGNPSAPASARSVIASGNTPTPVFTIVAAGSRDEQIQQAREMRDRQQALMQDPAYRSAMLEQQKNSMRMYQRGLQRELGLSDEQYERFLELQAEQQLRGQEMVDPYMFTASSADHADAEAAAQEQMRKFQELQTNNEKELSSLLGEQKYRAYQEYQRTAGARGEVNSLNVALAEAGVPLREEQIKPLIRAIQDANDQLSHDMSQNVVAGQATVGFVAGNAVSGAPPDWQKRHYEIMREQQKRIRQSASHVLDDEQLEILASQQEERVRMQESQMRMMQAQQDAIARGEVPATPAGAFGGIAIANGVAVPD